MNSMAVTVQDVRDYLNGITEKELKTPTIEIQIKIAEDKASELGIGSNETFILKWAAWKSFLSSELISQIKIHDLTAKKDLDARIQGLKDAVDEVLESLDGLVVESTPMFDDRPIDDSEGRATCWPD